LVALTTNGKTVITITISKEIKNTLGVKKGQGQSEAAV